MCENKEWGLFSAESSAQIQYKYSVLSSVLPMMLLKNCPVEKW